PGPRQALPADRRGGHGAPRPPRRPAPRRGRGAETPGQKLGHVTSEPEAPGGEGGSTHAPGSERESTARRAARLLRWYPAAWQARYGDEFTELLIAEFAERPRSWRRAADVAPRRPLGPLPPARPRGWPGSRGPACAAARGSRPSRCVPAWPPPPARRERSSPSASRCGRS